MKAVDNIPPVIAAGPPRAGTENGTICGIIASHGDLTSQAETHQAPVRSRPLNH